MKYPSSSRLVTPIEALETRIAPATLLVDLGSLTGTNGFKVNGVANDDLAGVSVSPAGDVNGDGRADFIVGAAGVDFPGAAAGASYVVFGRATAFGATFDLASLDGTNGFRITGEAAGDDAGFSVSRAGDVNGDGFGDLLVGAPGNAANGVGAGAAYIVYGKRTFSATPVTDFSVSLGATTGVTKIAGQAANDLFGQSVSAAGDVNRDGRADIIVGAPGAGSFAGSSYVIFGKTGGLGASFNLSTLNGANGFKINGEAVDDNFGSSVNSAGDVNGDGFGDLIMGAYSASTNGNDYSGAAYVIFGKASGFTATLALSSLNGTNGFKINGALADDSLGSAVSGAGDVNGDGFGDLVLGARTADRNTLVDSGTAYVVFGKRTGFTAELDLSSLATSAGFEIPGHEASAQLGKSVSRAGDLNADGFADVLIGASLASPNSDTDAGSAYAIFGKRDGFTATLSLGALNGINGFRINGASAGDSAGVSVAAAGDINRDGFADILVGGSGASATPGAAYVIYGTALPVRISADGRAAVLTDTDGDTIVVRVNKGRLDQDDFTLGANDRGLVALDLTGGTEFQGATVSITATSAAITGIRDGLVHVGSINATGIDLVAVGVEGDLGQIDAGDATLTTAGLGRLSVRSLSALAGSPLTSEINGNLTAFSSLGNVLGTVDVTGSIGAVGIAGSLDGSAGGTTAGLLRATGSIGTVSITQSVTGGADASGIVAGYKIGTVTIGGNLTSADAAKPVGIIADGKLPSTTATDVVLAISSITVKGNVLNAQILADKDNDDARTDSNAAISSVVVRGTWTDSLLHSTGNIGAVAVLGDFTGTNTLGIIAGRRIGSLSFGQDVLSLNSSTPLIIAAAGDLGGSALANLAINTISVKGDVTNAWFLGGYGEVNSGGIGPVNDAARIGTAVFAKTWNASNLIAGVSDGTGDGFGRNDTTTGASRIGTVVIRGLVTNNGIAGSHFGISAQSIGAASISGVLLGLTAASVEQSFALGTTGDIRLVEAPLVV